MNDALEYISISPGRHRFEEVSRDAFAACSKPRLRQMRLGALHRVLHVEENTVHVRMRLQNNSEQCTVPSADVDDGAQSCEIVGAHDLPRHNPGEINSGLIENGSRVRIPLQMLETVGTDDELPRTAAGLHAVEKVAPKRPLATAPVEETGR